MEQTSGPDFPAARARWVSPSEVAPPALDDDEDVIDAEIADVPMPAVSADPTLAAEDYSEAGVPSLAEIRRSLHPERTALTWADDLSWHY